MSKKKSKGEKHVHVNKYPSKAAKEKKGETPKKQTRAQQGEETMKTMLLRARAGLF